MIRPLLWVHRPSAGIAGSTGIGRYVIDLVLSLHRVGVGEVDLTIGACAETGPAAWVPDDIAVARMRGPRNAVHLSWLLGAWPKVDHLAGAADLVHVTHPSFPVPCRAPLIYTIHDLMPITNPSWHGRVERVGFRRSLDDARRRGALTLVNSSYVGEQLVSLAGFDPASVRTIYPGIHGRFATPATPDALAATRARFRLDRPYLLYLGTVTERKHLDVVVAALADPSLHGLDLVLAGPDRGDAARLRAEADHLGVGDRVHLTGFVDEGDLAPLVQGAATLVHPSVDEGFGFTPLEAMTAGTPTVVSDRGSLPEIVGDAALVVPGDDPADWAKSIAQVVGDATTADRLRKAGRERAATFTWDAHARGVIDTYRQVLDAEAMGAPSAP